MNFELLMFQFTIFIKFHQYVFVLIIFRVQIASIGVSMLLASMSFINFLSMRDRMCEDLIGG
jgi:hypothetical protein